MFKWGIYVARQDGPHGKKTTFSTNYDHLFKKNGGRGITGVFLLPCLSWYLGRKRGAVFEISWYYLIRALGVAEYLFCCISKKSRCLERADCRHVTIRTQDTLDLYVPAYVITSYNNCNMIYHLSIFNLCGRAYELGVI